MLEIKYLWKSRISEARLDDAERQQLMKFYENKRVLWEVSLKLSKKDGTDQKEAAIVLQASRFQEVSK